MSDGGAAHRIAPHDLARLTELFEHCADAVVLVGPDGRVTEAGARALDLLPIAPGDPVDELFAPADRLRIATDVLPRAVREGRWAGEVAAAWRAGASPARALVIGHRAPEGALLAVSVVLGATAEPRTLADDRGTERSLDDALGLAVGAAAAVAAVHRHGLVHRDVQARAFAIGPGAQDVRITGLWSARPLAPGILPPREVTAGIRGALPYLSPELTGRVNRPVDRRSDLYSLGVVLYELLSGRLPLEGDDALDWVHAHVARTPAPMRARAPELPEVIERIVMRLLCKSPEDRYQSATGLLADLERCRRELQGSGEVTPFALGERDVSDVFAVPQRLYGRDTERDALLGAFMRVASSHAGELVLVSGPAGAGKSALAQTLREPAAQARGTFVTGKLDGVARDVPYAPFAQALGELVQQALAEPPDALAARAGRLRAAVGANGRIVCDLVPRAELLLGTCPALPELPLPEAQRRVQRVIGDVLDAFAAEHPVVLFLDDLQWADPATVQLVAELVSRPRPSRLLVVAAYRDDEVEPTHPLGLALHDLRAGAATTELAVGPWMTPRSSDCSTTRCGLRRSPARRSPRSSGRRRAARRTSSCSSSMRCIAGGSSRSIRSPTAGAGTGTRSRRRTSRTTSSIS